MKRSLLLTSTLWFASCGSLPSDTENASEAILAQTILLPIWTDQDYSGIWHPGNWHGTTGNPYPDYCRTTAPTRGYPCIDDMQDHGDTDTGDRDHLYIAGGIPPWGTDNYDAGAAKQGFGVRALSTQITPGQYAAITSIDNVEIRITGSVTPAPWGQSESIQLFAPFETFVEVGDPIYITQDGNAHEIVWDFPSNPRWGGPWMKDQLPVAWEIENGNAIGPTRPGGLFVHSVQVYVSYH